MDNIGALQALSETQDVGTSAVKTVSRQIAERLNGNRRLLLTYTSQADGCKRDEIVSFAEYLQATDQFDQISITPLIPEVDPSSFGAVYINGSYRMASEFVGESLAVENIKKQQQTGNLLIFPAQFEALDSKESLVNLSQQQPDLFLPTTKSRSEINGPVIAKPVKSESLKGIVQLEANQDSSESEYVYQPYQPVITDKKLICVDSKTKTITQPEKLFEKLNIWISGTEVLGVVATYDTQPEINDAGYNLPISWRTK